MVMFPFRQTATRIVNFPVDLDPVLPQLLPDPVAAFARDPDFIDTLLARGRFYLGDPPRQFLLAVLHNFRYNPPIAHEG